MKKTLRVLALITALTLVIGCVSAVCYATGGKLGDANSDSNFNSKDVLLLRKYVAKQKVTIDLTVCDVNFDTFINAKDVLLLRRVLAHQIPMPEPPITEYEVPSDYPEYEHVKASVNQVGFTPDASKTAVFKVNAAKDTYECYVVDVKTGKAIYKGTSDRGVYDGVSAQFVSSFDFSSVKTPGKYYIASPLGRTCTFEIKDHVYDDVQDKLVTALYYNRCGQALDSKIVDKYYDHGVCHAASDVPVYFINILDQSSGKYGWDRAKASTSDKFVGGLHDAGDYGRYSTPANGVVADLIYMTEMFKNGCTTDVITDKGGEKIADTLDEARYEMNFLLNMQNPDNGGVYFRIVTKAFSGWTDNPDNDTYYNGGNGKGLYASREMVKPTAGMAGCAAACYTAFKNIDPTFANKCLTAAKKAYDYVGTNIDLPGAKKEFSGGSEINGANAGDYGSSEVYGDYLFAAAALYRATGEEKYNTMFKDILDNHGGFAGNFTLTSFGAYSMGGAGALAYILNDKADATYKQKLVAKFTSSANSSMKTAKSDKYGVCFAGFVDSWGSNAAIGGNAKCMAIADYLNGTKTYDKYIRDALSFILGCNGSGYCMVTGCGSRSPKQPHHRPSIHNRYSYGATPAPGFVVGGVSGSEYIDAENDYKRNEVAIYWNTPVSYALASVIANEKAK